MTTPERGRTPGRWRLLLGTVVLFGLGVLIGLILQNVVLGLLLAGLIWLGWVIARQSSRGHTPKHDDIDDDGARL
ncbi:hypothetical protein GCM10022240_17050 [Microbacterium kribbense]|uniref:Uncharacterized protein n=1 Tax=Microbacterium kribbense TaxID=433645 RepID=A0ABP7GIG5_9MICO